MFERLSASRANSVIINVKIAQGQRRGIKMAWTTGIKKPHETDLEVGRRICV